MRLIIFGTGLYYKNRKGAEALTKNEIVAFLDNDTQKQGSQIDSILIMSPAAIQKLEYDYIVLMSGFQKEMQDQLLEYGIDDEKVLTYEQLINLYENGKNVIRNIAIFGTGRYYNNRKDNPWLKAYRIISFLDNDEKKQGKLLDGVLIQSPNNVHQLKYDKIVLASIWQDEMKAQLLQLGISPEKIIGFNELYLLTAGKKGIFKEPELLDISNADTQIEQYEELMFPYFENPRVTIIIPAYNQFNYTYACLKSIKKYTVDVSYEIILADDCSTDATCCAEKKISGINIIHNKMNLRFLLNCNEAAHKARGEFLLFLNNDTQVQAGWLEPMVALLDRDKTIGMTGAKLIFPDGSLQEAGGIFWNDGSAWNYGRDRDPEDAEFNYVKDVDYISGAAIMIRKKLWDAIGGFDERFVPAYCEDADLAFEVRKRGKRVVFQPLSTVVHFEGISNGKNICEGLKAYQVINSQKFADKWREVLKCEHFANGTNVFLARDRSKNKKHILVVDHYVPRYDKDAGGKTTYMYLLQFVKKGFKVTFIGDNFLKSDPYGTILCQNGIEVLYGSNYALNWNKWLEQNGNYFDYIYFNRPHITMKYLDWAKRCSNAKILYYAVDLHFLREYRQYQITKDENLLESSKRWKKIEYEIVKKVDVVHVVGTYEQQYLQREFPEKIIRNIPVFIYEHILEDIPKNFSERKDLLFVGGFEHTPNLDAVLWFAKEVYPHIVRKYPDIRWHIVGSKVPTEVKQLACKNIIVEGFLPDDELEKLYKSCRLAVVPLRYGAGVKGKVVEAAYFQIPLVTTSIGAEGLSQKENTMLVKDSAEGLAQTICELYVDFDKLYEMSENGKKFIEEYCSPAKAESVLNLDMKI